MGVSVAEGTVVEWKKQVGDWVEADEIIASISTDKIDTDVESPATGRVAEIIVDVGETVDVGTVMARIATDAKPGEAHVSENGARHGRGRGGDRGARRGRRAVRRHDRRARGDGPAAAPRRRRAPLLARGHADRGRARRRPRAGRGHRPRRAREQEGRARVSWSRRPKEEPPMHIESPYRPDEPVTPKAAQAAPAAGRGGPAQAPAPAPGAGAGAGRRPARSRACARRSARGWCSRCRPRRPARRSPRPT